MAGNKDINNRRALGWKKPNLSKVDGISIPSTANKAQLLNGIRSLVEQQVKVLNGDKSQQKYRNIIELLMTRIKSDIGEFNYNALTKDDIDSLVKNVSDALGKNSNAHQLTLNEYAQKVIDALNEKLNQKNINTTKDEDAETNNAQISNAASPVKSNRSTFRNAEILSNPAIEMKYASIADFNISIQKQFDDLYALCTNTSTVTFETNKKTSIEYLIESTEKLDEKQTKSKVAETAKSEKKKKKEKKEKKRKKGENPLDASLNVDELIDANPNIFKKVDSSLACLAASIAVCKAQVDADTKMNMLDSCSIISKAQASLLKVVDNVLKIVKPSILSKIMEFIGNRIKGFFLNKILAPFKTKILDKLKTKFKPLVDHIKQFFKAMRVIGRIIRKEFTKLAKRAYRLAKRILNGFLKLFKPIIKGIRMLLSGLVKALKAAFRLVGKILSYAWRVVKAAGRFIKALFSGTKIGKLFGRIGKIAKGVSKFIVKAVKAIFQSPGKALKAAKAFIGRAFTAVKTKIVNIAKGIAKGMKILVKTVVKGVVKGIKTVVKNTTKAIAKKLGLNIAKQIAKKKAKSLLMTGAKKLMGFFKKWVLKLIAKLALKIAGAAAVNAIPILGQIVSVCMMLYTIIDTILMFYDVYKFMKENPPAMQFIKEQVAKWADKAFNFVKDLCAFGKKLFIKIFIEGPKKLAKTYAHAWNFIFNPVSTITNKLNKNRYEADLLNIKNAVFYRLNSMKPEERAKYIKDRFDGNTKMLDKFRSLADDLTAKITKEEDSWWPDQKKISEWMALRQSIFEKMMKAAAEIGLNDFSKETQSCAVEALKEVERQEAARVEMEKKIAVRRKELAMKYENKHIDLNALKDICAGYKHQHDDYIQSLKDLCSDIKKRGNATITTLDTAIDGLDDEEDNDAVVVA